VWYIVSEQVDVSAFSVAWENMIGYEGNGGQKYRQ
jgi:hypothetical protein